MHDSFYAFIQKLSPEFQVDINLLKSVLKSRKVCKGEILFHRGDICDFVAFTYKGCLRSFVLKDDKEYTLLIDTPQQRYLKLIEAEPQLLQRIPQYYLASYLGIEPESLSILKRRVYKNKNY